ncbi:MAG: glycoside hydrolase family 38 C-terminal domain-containing protein [Ilumatobacter sp.]|uniref:glycoside hydrolase family 38 N-terminal domain-containing protein n=1 Tax=Ilumatobacter sp. TaxID=1967498 RepID=UPI00391C7E03
MHDDCELIERRIDRELWERVLPLVHLDRRRCSISAGPSPDALAPFEVGAEWGRPWQTTWFELTAEVPEQWLHRSGTRIEVVIDLGFTRSPAGFQAEGLVVDRERMAADGTVVALQGIHPRRTGFVIHPDRIASDGTATVLVEAASNPTFPQFSPSPDGLLDTAVDRALYRFRTADLVLVDLAMESLSHDLDVLDGHMRTLPPSEPRRARIRQAIVTALDAIPDASVATVVDVTVARRPLRPFLEPSVTGAAGPGRHRIVATGHAHIDTAWLWPIRETIRKCTRTFASATALMDDDPSYVFSCSQAQQYAWIEERHPGLFGRIRERVERGQWVPVGGMWVEADMNLPSGESLARQIVFGQRYFESRFGKRCREVWIPDVFGYPAGLPQLFRAGGMDRFVTQKLSWNKQNRFPHHTFWWEGLDGSRVLTHFPPVDTYNAEITPEEIARSIERFQDHAWSGVSLMPFGHGDGGGGPTREMLERAARLVDLDHRAVLEIGSAADVFTAIEREATLGAPVPVWRGELYFEMHRGTLTSQLRTKLGNRRCERLLVEAELWAATLGHPADVDELWTEVLTQQFHDILPGSSIAWVHRDAEEVFERVGDDLESRISNSLAELAESVGGHAIANPADALVDGVVVLPVEHRRVLDGAEPASIQVLSDGSVAARLAAPPLAVTALRLCPPTDRVVVSDSSMANGHLAVRWGRTGELTSVIDLATRRELIPEGELAAVLMLGRDRPVEYDAWDLESWTRPNSTPVGAGSVTVDDSGPLVGRATVARSFGASTATVTYELHAGSRQLLVHVHLDWHHDEHLLSMTFPLDVRADTAACDVQFGVTHRPTHPSSPWDAAKFEVCAHRYVSVAEPSFGAAVINDGRYGHAVFDGAISVSLARAAKYPDPDADQGRHRVSLALRPHDGDLADVRAAAARLNRPVRVVEWGSNTMATESILHEEGLHEPIITVSSDRTGESGVEVDAVKLADDGSGDLIVRLHEAVGDRCRLALRGRRRLAMAWRCNLLEEPERGEEVGDGVVSTPLRPFELVTLRLRFAASDFDGR